MLKNPTSNNNCIAVNFKLAIMSQLDHRTSATTITLQRRPSYLSVTNRTSEPNIYILCIENVLILFSSFAITELCVSFHIFYYVT